MPLQINCPQCRTPLRVPDQAVGKKVRCKSCDEIFTVPDQDAEPDDRPAARIQDRPRPAAGPARLRDLDEEKVRRPRLRDEDDEEDTPRRRKPLERRPSGAPTGLIVAAALGGVMLLAIVAGGAWWVFSSSTPVPAAPGGVVALADPANPGGGNPIAGQPPAVIGGGPVVGGGVVAAGTPPLRYRWRGGPHVYAVKVEIEREEVIETHEGNCVVRAAPGGPARVAVPAERRATGTAFVVNANGYLITCAHVVAEATKIEVGLGGRVFAGTVIALDHDHDLAVLQIPANGLPTVPLANSDAAEVGQSVTALGFPLSSILGDNLKVTRGILSGVNNRNGRKVFQVDASINPGNSGGPLVNENGEVLGVNSAKLSGDAVSNVGFVTPSNEAKRLLTGKNVAFAAGAAGGKLDGPALVKAISPAVALVTVTLGPGAARDTFRLSCSGHLFKRERSKNPNVILMPRPPSFPRFGTGGSQIEMDASGRILRADGGTQLPLLLGEMGVFLCEPLPQDNRPNWEVSGTCTLTESSGSPFGPRMAPPFMPRPRFGPRRPFEGQQKTREAQERSTYTRGAVAGDTVTINKQYELKAAAVGDSPGLVLSGNGTITFDAKEGFPRGVEFRATLTVTRNNTTSRIPIAATYRLLAGPEREKILNPPPPPPQPKVEPKPFTGNDLTQALADLKGQDRNRRRSALDRIAQAKPDAARQAEVAKALEEVLGDSDNFVRGACLKALAVWGTKDQVPALLPLLEDGHVFTRWEAMTTLSKIGDERAAAPLAARLTVLSDRSRAGQALREMGKKAEKAVQAILKEKEWSVRLEACRILRAIGTKDSVAALKAASKDGNRLVAREAEQAAREAATR